MRYHTHLPMDVAENLGPDRDPNLPPLSRDEQYKLIGNYVGNTIIKHTRISDEEPFNSALVKAEYENLSGSHYDRAYLSTLRHFEAIGYIRPGDELRDISSGSAGISLARIGVLLGYKVRILVPDELPNTRIEPMQVYGAEVVRVGSGYVPAASQAQFEEITAFRENPSWKETRPMDKSGRSVRFEKNNRGICFINHSENELTTKAFSKIADEIAWARPDATHLILAEGNWTTIAGIAPRIRELMHHIKIVGYHGELNSAGQTENYGTIVPNVPIRFADKSLVDDEVIVTNKERDSMQKYAPKLGRSSLMGLYVAQHIKESDPQAKVVTIGYDLSDRY